MSDNQCKHGDMVPLRTLVSELGRHENQPELECWHISRYWRCAQCGRTYTVYGNVSISVAQRDRWQDQYPNDEWAEVVRRVYDEGGPLAASLPPQLEAGQ